MKIWRLLYGDRTIHVFEDHAQKPASCPRAMRYAPCQAGYTHQQVYDDMQKHGAHQGSESLSVRLTRHETPCTGKPACLRIIDELPEDSQFCLGTNTQIREYPRYDMRSRYCVKPIAFPVLIVCRQQWDDVSTVVYDTATFALSTPQGFRRFVDGRPQMLERVKRLQLSVDFTVYFESPPTKYWDGVAWKVRDGWDPCSIRRNLGRLPSVRILNLVLRRYVCAWSTDQSSRYMDLFNRRGQLTIKLDGHQSVLDFDGLRPLLQALREENLRGGMNVC
jgi:hypothetical protein